MIIGKSRSGLQVILICEVLSSVATTALGHHQFRTREDDSRQSWQRVVRDRGIVNPKQNNAMRERAGYPSSESEQRLFLMNPPLLAYGIRTRWRDVCDFMVTTTKSRPAVSMPLQPTWYLYWKNTNIVCLSERKLIHSFIHSDESCVIGSARLTLVELIVPRYCRIPLAIITVHVRLSRRHLP